MTDITTNVTQVNDRIRKEVTRLINSAFKSGLSSAASKIKRKAWQLLKSKIKSDTSGLMSRGKAIFSDTLQSGIRRTKVKVSQSGDNFWVMSTINSAGRSDPKSGAYRLHILEEGATNSSKKTLKTRGFWSTAENTANVDFDKSVSDSCKKAQKKIDDILK